MNIQDIYESVGELQLYLTEITERLEAVSNGKNYNTLEASSILADESFSLSVHAKTLDYLSKNLRDVYN